MSVLSDRWIKKMALEKEMIKPFIAEQKSGSNISYGLSSFGYDASSDTGGGGQRARTKDDSTNFGGTETRPRNIALLACIKY